MQPEKVPKERRLLPEEEAARRGSYVSSTKTSIFSSVKERITTSLRDGTLAFSDWLLERTPSFLIPTFYVVSTAIFCLSNEEAIKVFYFCFVCINFYTAACCVIESFLALTPARDARKASIEAEASGLFPSDLNGKAKDLPTIDLVIVAYLPNEKDIIRSQVLYACEELIYPKEKLRINLVYNTPYLIEPLETEISMLTDQCPNLRVIRVPGSKSKADNLNYFFSLHSEAEIIGIFDSDHCPHPHNPRWAAERFLSDSTIDIIQGRCIIYNTNESWLTRMIAIEFDKLHALSHPGRSRMFGFGLVSGSNAYWKAPFLRTHKMHGELLTEDFDSALRAYAQGKTTIHDMNVCSFETAPLSFQAFCKQRLRWAQGWTQVSIKHLPRLLLWGRGRRTRTRRRNGSSPAQSGNRALDRRYGIFSLLVVSEFTSYFVSLHACLLFSFVIVDRPASTGEFFRLLFFRYPMAEWFFFGAVVSLMSTLYFTNKVRSEFTSWKDMVLFAVLYIPYLMLMATMGLYGHCRQMIGYSSWNPTARK